LPGAHEYDTALAAKLLVEAHKAANPMLPTRSPPRARNWKLDPVERCRRIWLWWKIRLFEVNHYQFNNVAVRLVALVQPSSCGLERDFSQLKLITDQCGEMLESTLESRMYERCCKGGFPMK